MNTYTYICISHLTGSDGTVAPEDRECRQKRSCVSADAEVGIPTQRS